MLNLKSYAKINLFLRVLDKRLDGYHDLDSIFQSISLFDELSIVLKGQPGIDIVCGHPLVPAGERNIVYKAVKALPVQKSGVKVEIKKNIPVAAGLGGGSSNAAAVLTGLNKLWNLGLNREQLMKIGAKIGADVPFCLVGGRARVWGKGEKVESSKQKAERKQEFFIIVKPNFEVSTAWAYSEFDKLTPKTNYPAIHYYYNSLEEVVIPRYPEIGQIKQKLLGLGASAALMSGSGPAVFGVFEDKQRASNALKTLKQVYSEIFLVEPVPSGLTPIIS